LALTGDLIDPRKAIAIIVVSDEVAKFQNPAAASLFDTELKAACVAAVDSVFLQQLYAGTTPGTSAGGTAANVLTDFNALLSNIAVNSESRLFWSHEPDAGKNIRHPLQQRRRIVIPGTNPDRWAGHRRGYDTRE
jgi:hypothetical protein